MSTARADGCLWSWTAAAHPALRRAVLLVPLIAGFLFSLTGVILGWRRRRRMI